MIMIIIVIMIMIITVNTAVSVLEAECFLLPHIVEHLKIHKLVKFEDIVKIKQ